MRPEKGTELENHGSISRQAGRGWGRKRGERESKQIKKCRKELVGERKPPFLEIPCKSLFSLL